MIRRDHIGFKECHRDQRFRIHHSNGRTVATDASGNVDADQYRLLAMILTVYEQIVIFVDLIDLNIRRPLHGEVADQFNIIRVKRRISIGVDPLQ